MGISELTRKIVKEFNYVGGRPNKFAVLILNEGLLLEDRPDDSRQDKPAKTQNTEQMQLL